MKPTVGRKVWYRPFGHDRTELKVWNDKQPCDATVTYVWHDRMVNLLVVGPTGAAYAKNSVQLLQEGDPVPTLLNGGYAEWMPYQVGQAKAQAPVVTVAYTDGTTATGVLPLPAESPAQQESPAPAWLQRLLDEKAQLELLAKHLALHNG